MFHKNLIVVCLSPQTPADDAGLSDDAAATLREERPSPDIEDGLTLLTIPNVPSAVYNLTTNRYVR